MIKTAVLENNSIRCAVDASGVVHELVNKKTGASLIMSGNGLTGWKMITDLGRWREHPIYENDNEGEINSDGSTAIITFDGLKGEKAKLNYIFTITYSLRQEGELTAKMHVENKAEDTLREIWFPFFAGIRDLNYGKTHHLIVNSSMGMTLDNPACNLPSYDGYTFASRSNGEFQVGQFLQRGIGGRYPLIYPGNASMPWMDYYNDIQGWYLGYHDMETPSISLLMRRRLLEKDMQLGFCRFPFIKPGQTWESGDYVIRPHGGGWHEGARRYTQFAEKKIKKGEIPDWLKPSAGFHIVSMITQGRGIRQNYDYIYEQFKEDQKNGLNLPMLVFGWVRSGFDNSYPEYEADERIGGAAKLKETIKRVQAEGGHVMLYTQGRLIDMCTDYYATKGKDCCYKSEDGVPYTDEYLIYSDSLLDPNRKFVIACPSTDEWKRQLKHQIDIVMDLGADGILFDQIGADVPYICFDESHNHTKPEMATAGKINLLQELQLYAKTRDPHFAILGELVCDVFLQHLDMVHGNETHESTAHVYPEGLHPTPEIYRYTFPAHRSTSRNCETKEHFNTTFVNGLLFEHSSWRFRFLPLEKRDDLRLHLLSLERLREKTMQFLNNSRFVDDENLFCQPGCFMAKHYVNNDGTHCIAITNKEEHTMTARFSIGQGFKKAEVYGSDGSITSVKLTDDVVVLPMDGESAALVVITK